MLMIRLQRTGKKKQAHFRVVLQEHTWKTKGKYLELFGTYDPHAKKLEVNKERIEYWMSQGSQISPTVNNLMVNYKVWDREKMKSWKPKVKEAGAEPEKTTAPVVEKVADTESETTAEAKSEASPETADTSAEQTAQAPAA